VDISPGSCLLSADEGCASPAPHEDSGNDLCTAAGCCGGAIDSESAMTRDGVIGTANEV